MPLLYLLKELRQKREAGNSGDKFPFSSFSLNSSILFFNCQLYYVDIALPYHVLFFCACHPLSLF